MQYFKFFVVLFFVSFKLSAQGIGGDPQNWYVELFLGFSNCPQPNSYTFYLENSGTVWAANNGFTPPGFFINQNSEFNTSSYPWHVRNTVQSNDWKGWNMVYSQDQTTILDTAVPVYAYGLYKFSTNASNKYFYIDYRDDRIPYNNIPSNNSVDHWIKYNFNNNTFYYSTEGPSGPFISIANAEYLKFCEMQETSPVTPSTNDFPEYWDNCLVVTNDIDNHPRLVWGPYPDNLNGNIIGYRIYRSSTHIPGQPPGNFYLLSTLDSDEYEFIDYNIIIGNDYNARSYYVTCLYEDNWKQTEETESTNIAEVRLAPPQKTINGNQTYKSTYDYYLSQNFPNPFNPTTKISFSITEKQYVELKIFDILGREIQTLINEVKEPGNYNIIFNGYNLPSGIYLYSLKAGNFSETKKLIHLN